MVTLGVQGGPLRVLVEGGDPAWSAKGDVIAYTTDVGGTEFDYWNRIAVIRPDGTRRRLVLNDRRAWRSALEFSPDGRRLLLREAELATTTGGHGGACSSSRAGASRRSRTSRSTRARRTLRGRRGARIGYLQDPSAPSGERTPPTEVRSIRPDGTGDQLLFSLPFDEQRGRWADTLSWRR